jgi:DNA-directed RNA polymerase specialized sigma24 family protein
VAEQDRSWSRDAGELAACFTVHARDLFGHACALADADRDLAGDLVQATFEAAAGTWCTLRDLPAGQCRSWLRDTLAAAAQRRTGHPAGRAFPSPSHWRITELKTARFRSGYDAAAALERFTRWLQTRAPGPPAGRTPAGPGPAGPAYQLGARLGGRTGIRPASLHALPEEDEPDGNRPGGNGGSGRAHGTRAGAPPGNYGDPVSALYEQHYASLVRLAALLVRDTATAEEIVQDSFVAVAAAWRRRGDTDGALDFLRQSVLNRSRSALRHGISPAPGAAGCPSGPAPLLAALGELPARQREVLVLRYYANLSEEQAADTIGISRAAVRRHATRANAALRTLLDAG